MGGGGILWLHHPFCCCTEVYPRIFHSTDVHPTGRAAYQGRGTEDETQMGTAGRYSTRAALGCDGKRGRTIHAAPRFRLRRHREGGKTQPAEQETKIRSKYDLTTNCQKRIPMARKNMGEKGIRGVFHRTHRDDVEQGKNYGGVSQLHRDGRRDIRCRCRGGMAFPLPRQGPEQGRMCADSRLAAQSKEI